MPDHVTPVGSEDVVGSVPLIVPAAAADTERRRLVARGLTWSALYQATDAMISFAAMLLLVRLIGPSDYGRASAVIGILALLNSFNASVFIGHALQLPDGIEPDWQLHWTFAFYIQGTLSVLCHAAALASWFIPAYRPIAPLLHLAACGLLLDWPNQIGATMLRRELNLRRVKIVAGASTLVKLGCTVGVALAGGGAVALVLGNNVVGSLPFALDLLLVRRWRPRAGWWRLPDVRAYRKPATFGAQRVLAGGVAGLSAALEAAVVPGSLGFAAFGLLTRARALYSTTLGRIAGVVLDTVYPFLPREAHEPARYARQAGRFLQVVLLLAIPGTLFLSIEGQQVSRVLYGQRWAGMDLFILPGALSGLALTVLSVSCLVLMAAGRMRECLALEMLAAVLAIPALSAAWLTGRGLVYCWMLTVTEGVAALAALTRCGRLLEPNWVSSVLLPPTVVTAIATITALIAGRALEGSPHAVHLCVTATAYAITLTLGLRLLFPRSFAELLDWIPGGRSFRFYPRIVPVSADPGVSG